MRALRHVAAGVGYALAARIAHLVAEALDPDAPHYVLEEITD